MQGNEADKTYLPMHLVGFGILFMLLYWHGYGFWIAVLPRTQYSGAVLDFLDRFSIKLHDGGMLGEYSTKFLLLLLVFIISIVKSGKSVKKTWKEILIMLGVSLVVFFFPYITPLSFILTTLTGYLLLLYWIAILGRKMKGAKEMKNDKEDTFDQMTEKIDTKYSVNMPTRFKYKGTWHNGWVNVVNPFRGSLLYGVPGSGKSYAVYYQFIDQMIRKGYVLFTYDYKFPDLTEIVYNKWLQYYPQVKEKYKRYDYKLGKEVDDVRMVPPEGAPQFCILNFDDPRKSMRCNPLDSRYLTDMSDAHEVADLIMKNVNPKSVEKEDFFSMSAKVYIAGLVWFLKKYKNGIYCSFPHLIELMGKDYKDVFVILQQDEELQVMIRPFADALKDKAQEQLQGQIASARIPLLKFPSASLYWTLTGDDFALDINNPDAPKIVCMGNNPDRQAIYGTTLALYTSRLFKVINHKYNAAGKRNLPCGVMLDELPTIFIKGLDNLIATARSNLVAILMGAQDKSQLVRDYTREEATVIMNTVGNVFAGQVNGETARDLSQTFGREFRLQESETTGASDSVSRSYQQQEILPQSTIETLTQGWFVGKVADDAATPIDKKLFAGKFVIDSDARSREEKKYKKVPRVGAAVFNEDFVEATIRKDEVKEIKQYLCETIRDEHERKAKYDPHYNMPLPDMIYQDAEEQYEELIKDPEKKEELMVKIIKKRQDQKMREMIYENYKKIKQDIDMIMHEYNLDNSGEDDGENEDGGDFDNDDNGGGDDGGGSGREPHSAPSVEPEDDPDDVPDPNDGSDTDDLLEGI